MKNKLQKLLTNKLAKDILHFFYQNQTSIDSVGGVAAWVNSDRASVVEVLDALADIGALEKDSMGRTMGYCYTRDKETMGIIKLLMENA